MRGQLPAVLMHLTNRLPLRPLEIVLQHLVANALAANSSLPARLGDHAADTFAIDPVDCPLVFLLTPSHGKLSLRVRRDLTDVSYAARVAAPLVVLLGLLDGSYDGDALFFSRDLVIEGDTAAVLALRNAIENAELDPATVAGLPAGLKGSFNRMVTALLTGVRRILDAPEPTGMPGEAETR